MPIGTCGWPCSSAPSLGFMRQKENPGNSLPCFSSSSLGGQLLFFPFQSILPVFSYVWFRAGCENALRRLLCCLKSRAPLSLPITGTGHTEAGMACMLPQNTRCREERASLLWTSLSHLPNILDFHRASYFWQPKVEIHSTLCYLPLDIHHISPCLLIHVCMTREVYFLSDPSPAQLCHPGTMN